MAEALRIAALREQVARKVADLYGCPVNMDTEVTITAGATEAIFCAITAVVRPGDEVIVPAPYWVSYVEQIRFCGGVPVVIYTARDLTKAERTRLRSLAAATVAAPRKWRCDH